ncbi:hypothetical protein EVAR_40157_1 [Eumeta japonica]|uniref:Uncharacterized protein n=1 Tax=Eumeta variegata TaxID=151549 RepID=A0A4C1YIU3_EUMVA|nr:hypothetical protein EVAR_40157_1 [Eumeta japonica]
MSRAYVALSHSFFPSTVSLLLGRRRGNRWTPNFGTQISEDPSSSPKSARPCRSRMKSLFLQYFTLARQSSKLVTTVVTSSAATSRTDGLTCASRHKFEGLFASRSGGSASRTTMKFMSALAVVENAASTPQDTTASSLWKMYSGCFLDLEKCVAFRGRYSMYDVTGPHRTHSGAEASHPPQTRDRQTAAALEARRNCRAPRNNSRICLAFTD